MNKINVEKLREEYVEKLREEYKKGTRIRLVQMDDVQAPPVGTEGTVQDVDDAGSILVKWDNGSSMNVLPDIDIIQKVVDKHGR